MEEKFIIRMDLPDEFKENSYYTCVSDSIYDCLRALASIEREAAEKGTSLHGRLFTIKGVKGTFRLDSGAWYEWLHYGGCDEFLNECRVLESVEQRVEDILKSLECGYRFKRMPMSGEEYEDVGFMCEYPYPISCFDMKFNFAMVVCVRTFKDGSKGIEYGCFEDLYDWDTRKDVCIRNIMGKSGMDEMDADKAWNAIADLIDLNVEAMHDIFGPEFEKRLPDVDIVDRCYYNGYLVAS